MMRSQLHEHLRKLAAASFVVCACTTITGCQLNRTFFQMDSDSKSPFFAFDFRPDWPKKTSSVEGVSRLQSETADVETAEDEKPPAVETPEPLTLPVRATDSDSQAASAPAELFR